MRVFTLFGLLCLLTAALYLPSFSNNFVYDDHWFVQRNPSLDSLTLQEAFADPSTVAAPASGLASDVYRPLATLSFALDKRLGLSPRGLRIENFAWFLFCGWMVWMIALKLGVEPERAIIAPALFLLHPAQAQAVAWIAQHSTLLSGAGMLGTFLVWWPTAKLSVARITAGALLASVALFSRETGVLILPLYALLVLLTILCRSSEADFSAQRVHWLALFGILFGAVAGYVMVRWALLRHWSQTPQLHSSQSLLGLLAFPVYLGKFIFPVALRASYAYPQPTARLIGGALAAIVLFGASFLWGLGRAPLLAWTLGWLVVALLPGMQILAIRTFVAERLLFLPLIGVALGAAFVQTPFLRGALGIWLLICTFSTAHSTAVWRSDTNLWENNVRLEPANAFARLCLADCTTDPREREAQYRAVLDSPTGADLRSTALNNLARLLWSQHRAAEATPYILEAERLAPQSADVLYNAVQIALATGRAKDAEARIQRLIQLRDTPPGMVSALEQQFKGTSEAARAQNL